MNEKRAKKAKYLTNTLVSDMDRQWRGLLGQLGVLEAKARVLDLETVVDLIDDLKNVIAKNQPNKKLFRAVQTKINEIDMSMKRIEFLLSKKKQNSQ
ncbi:MAG: hypothetical protein IJE79_00280 [Alphaproteobacteria bacterium]|nr:hypothetical protein [Alphaproteobacteria bacterium]